MKERRDGRTAEVLALFGRNMVEARSARGLTQFELSAKTGLPLQLVQGIEKGWFNCDLDTAEVLAAACGVPVPTLYKNL